ncbi:hypothetical protein [Mesorhizobium sp. WSM4884]|nr:hypothetical protein [Mesorhizobium sp. WSM4884]MDG4883025.1 hypothetical protein [Mesorhizobium sp. WSM4884]
MAFPPHPATQTKFQFNVLASPGRSRYNSREAATVPDMLAKAK